MGWRRWRDRWLGDPAVRQAIARGPIGRRIAARHADDLFGMVAGFVRSQWLHAGLASGALDALLGGARAWDGLTDLPPTGAHALRQGLIATGLVEERGDRVGLTIAGLVAVSDPAVRAMIAHDALLYDDLGDIGALLAGRPGRIAGFWPYRGAGGGESADYTRLMAASLSLVEDVVVARREIARASHVMDVGGGDGSLLRAVASRHPGPKLTLVDLPAVIERAPHSPRIAHAPVAPDSPLPRGADLVTLVRVLHDLDDGAALCLLARVADALPAGGSVLIAEPTARAGRDAQTAYFAAYFAAMGSGRLRPAARIAAMLRAAGFVRVRCDTRAPAASVIVARRM